MDYGRRDVRDVPRVRGLGLQWRLSSWLLRLKELLVRSLGLRLVLWLRLRVLPVWGLLLCLLMGEISLRKQA